MGKVDKFHEHQALNLAPEAITEGQADRRIRGERLLVDFPVFATFRGCLIQGYMEALNISWSGMMIATNFPLNVNDFIALEFTLPLSEVPIHIEARVVHKIPEQTPEEATRLGVAFLNMEPNVQRMISGFVLEHLPTE